MAKPIMHIRRGIAALLGLALWLVGAAPIPRGSVSGPPPPIPSSFWGAVTVNGQSIPAGMIITAGHNGVVYCTAATYLRDGASWYRLNVPGDDPDTPVHDGGVQGEVIEFTIGGLTADQTSVWQSGTNRQLDLTAAGVLPTQLPPFCAMHLPLLVK